MKYNITMVKIDIQQLMIDFGIGSFNKLVLKTGVSYERLRKALDEGEISLALFDKIMKALEE